MTDFRCLQRFSSDILWHFTGYDKSEYDAFDILKNILSQQLLKQGEPRFSIFQNEHSMPIQFGFVSLCDIPFKDLHLHATKYGDFGIAFNKTSAIISGYFNPVFYVQSSHFLTKYLTKIFPHVAEIVKHAESGVLLDDFLKFILAHFKPSDLTRPPTMTNEPDNWETSFNYYYEREWRSVRDWHFVYSDIELVIVPEPYKMRIKDFLKTINADLDVLSTDMISRL